MHEFGLARNILDIVESHVPPPRRPAIRVVRLRIGAEAGVVVESLRFCFEAIVPETPFPGASLEIERVPGDDVLVHAIELDEPAEVS